MASISDLSDEPLIGFPAGSLLARFGRREKRFRVEVHIGKERLWVHCNNSGSMLGLLREGAEVLISPAQKHGRILPYSLELIRSGDHWVGVNTLTPNRVLYLAWKSALVPELNGYESYRSEARVGASRLDAFLDGPVGPLWVEAKNVTLVEDQVAYFPDAPTIRGRKHLVELMSLSRMGIRSACFYLIQRADARCFAPADFIDAEFTDLFWQALTEGIEVWPYVATASPEGIRLGPRLNVLSYSQIPSL